LRQRRMRIARPPQPVSDVSSDGRGARPRACVAAISAGRVRHTTDRERLAVWDQLPIEGVTGVSPACAAGPNG